MGEFKYKAFLSYSHEDRRWANWLHRRLETYRVPRRLVGQSGSLGPIPARLSPVFRDREELPSSADLSQEIDAALAASETLIVICSPNAAKSRWVNAEIEAFIRLRSADRVLCFVVDGEPSSDDPEENPFPEVFASREPIAADAREVGDGRNAALLKIVAGLVGLGFDALRQREQQRRQRRLAAISVASFCGFLLTSGLAVNAYLARLEAESQRALAEAERATSQRTAEFMIDIFNVVDPAIARGREVSAKEVLDRGQAKIDALADEPSVQRNLLHTLGIVNTGIGEYGSAIELLAQAMQLQGNSNEGLETQIALAEALHLNGDLEESKEQFERARLALNVRSDDWDRTSSNAYNGLGEVLTFLDELASAEKYHREALDKAEATWPGNSPELGRSLHGLGLTLFYQNRMEEAGLVLKRALNVYESAVGPNHPRLLEAHNSLTMFYYGSGNFEAASKELEATAGIIERVLGSTHPSFASVLNNLGRLQLESGEVELALSNLQQSVDIDHLHGRDRHADLVFSLNSLGLARAVSGDDAGADEAFTEALSLADGTSHRLSGVIRVHRAVVACDDGKVSLA
ncbi:MAG: toll/interleukin-1 receptor domain-containing protein, partial [Pseudomonadota bacterium]